MGLAKNRLTTPTPEQSAGAAPGLRRSRGGQDRPSAAGPLEPPAASRRPLGPAPAALLCLRPPASPSSRIPTDQCGEGLASRRAEGPEVASRKTHLVWVWRRVGSRPHHPNSGPRAPSGLWRAARAPPGGLHCIPTCLPCTSARRRRPARLPRPPRTPTGLPKGPTQGDASASLPGRPPAVPAPRVSPALGGHRPLSRRVGGYTRPRPRRIPLRAAAAKKLPRSFSPPAPALRSTARPRIGRVPGCPPLLPSFLASFPLPARPTL